VSNWRDSVATAVFVDTAETAGKRKAREQMLGAMAESAQIEGRSAIFLQ